MNSNSIPDAADFGVQTAAPARRHALVPILLGLMGPVVALSIIDVRALASASVIVHIYLFALFVIAAGAYAISVIEPGDITRVTVDRKARVVRLERTGLVARKTIEVPFSEISTVRVEVHGDDDGYETAMPVLVLKSRDVMPLPAGTTEADIATMRVMLKGAA